MLLQMKIISVTGLTSKHKKPNWMKAGLIYECHFQIGKEVYLNTKKSLVSTVRMVSSVIGPNNGGNRICILNSCKGKHQFSVGDFIVSRQGWIGWK